MPPSSVDEMDINDFFSWAVYRQIGIHEERLYAAKFMSIPMLMFSGEKVDMDDIYPRHKDLKS